jgi:hypothetical protein
VFIFADRAEDAKAIVIAWRGTEAFNAMDWSSDFDFSWYHLEGMGNVHVGFLEALGLANRDDVETFHTMQQNANDKFNNIVVGHCTSIMQPAHPTREVRKPALILMPFRLLLCSSHKAPRRLVSMRL